MEKRGTVDATLRQRRRAFSFVGCAMCVTAVALLLSACGGSSGSSSSSTAAATEASPPTNGQSAASTTESAATSVAYSGPDKQYMTEVPVPTKKPGFSFSIGFLQPAGFVPALVANQNGAEEEAKGLGGTFTALDANDSPQQQVSNFNDLLAKSVSGVVSYPLDPNALGPPIESANKAGVPVVQEDAPADLSEPPIAGSVSNVTQGWDLGSYETMKAIAELKPGVAFGVINSSSPIPALHYQTEREIVWGEKFGLKYTGEVSAQHDTPDAWAEATNALMQQFPETEVIVTYNDISALSALTALKGSGKNEVQVATSAGFSEGAKAAIESGGMLASFVVPWKAIGAAAVDIAYGSMTDQEPAGGYAAAYVIPSVVATKENLTDPAVTSEMTK